MKRTLLPWLAAATVVTVATVAGCATGTSQTRTGRIAGIVRDSATLKPVWHAQVVLRGTRRGMETDSLGRYRIDSVPVGKWALVVRRLGYQALVTDSIKVKPRRTTRENVRVTPLGLKLPLTADAFAKERADSGAMPAFREADTARGTVAYTGFSLRLFRELARATRDSNIVLSPASAAWALAMTADGAADSTWRAMAGVLGVDAQAPDSLGPANAATLASLGGQHGVELHIANSIWASEGRPFLPTFLEGTRRWYGAQVTSMPLHGIAARDRMNTWVARATEGKIPRIVDDTLPDTEVMVLLNAVYFHGRWRSVFDSTGTRPHAFTRVDQSVVSRPLMHKTEALLYLSDTGFRAVRLPYQGGRLAMYVFLPDSDQSLAAFVDRLDSARWTRWMHAFGAADMDVHMPSFHLEEEMPLIPPLTRLGMSVAFSAERADFSRMMPPAFLRDTNVFIETVLQRTYIEVNEQGTTAAAATMVGMMEDTSVPPPPIAFVVDRPFCVAIRDDHTGVILFLGQITDP
jgi:serine protease inhibitor